jgi:DNA-binding transcriptional regulator YiaG
VHDPYVQDICPSTAKNEHIYIRMLHDACKTLGGEHKLAEYLGVTVNLVEDWLNGKGRPPDSVFLRCIDVLEGEPPRIV